MKKLFVVLILGLALLFAAGILNKDTAVEFFTGKNVKEAVEDVMVPDNIRDVLSIDENIDAIPELPEMTVIAENLTIPWDIVFLPEGELLVSERSGNIVRINTEDGEVTEIAVPDVVHKGEGGLLGMVAHPDFEKNNYIYVYLTSTLDDGSNASVNEVVRYTFVNNTLTAPKIIVGNIPGSLFHNGGRIAFGPDELLYVTTGDARVPESSQDLNSLAGKILRVTDEGRIPSDNPFGTAVYSYGHRNPQGLSWDEDGRLWSTEHGRTTATKTGMDELNLIEPGGNYGWPDSEGDTVREGTIGPVLHSGPSVTWAPGGATYVDGSVFFGGLRGATLYEAVIDGESAQLEKHFVNEYGRIRTTLIGPDGGLYMMTSNRDGRGDVQNGDDKIIRLNPKQFKR